MSSSQNQTKNEKWILKLFLKLMDIRGASIKPGPMVKGNSSPDFVIQVNGRKIGIEETTYHRKLRNDESAPRQTKESAWQKLKGLIEDIRKKHKKLNKIRGIIRFRNFTLPPPKERESFADELVKFAVNKSSELGSGYKCYKSFDDAYRHLRKYIEYFKLKKVNSYIFFGKG